MTLPLHVREEAEVELRAARIWYDEKSPGLGKQFLSCVEAAFAVIGRHPSRFRQVFGEVRQALVRRFPFVVLYVIESDGIHVMAVFHGSRDPSEWQRRLG